MIRNRSVPSADVIPVLAYPDVLVASDWLCLAFGFRVRLHIGDHRAQLVVGEGAVIVTRAPADAWPPTGTTVHVRVADADAHHALAVAAGARILEAPTDFPYGERQYVAEDPGRHRWTFSQSIADIDPADWGGTATEPAEPVTG